ncbi:MAG: putative lipopolysaccharide heptosyltransferase III [Chlamydiales bacterium]|nr:putative lipopolysaccharide heptosyltransferase III [Chlamydiales bacterium]
MLDPSEVKKILVIKLRHHGDVLLTTPVFYNLKESFPNASIDAYVYKDTWPMLEGLPFIQQGILYDRSWKKKGFFYRHYKELLVLYKIWKNKYDIAINLTEGDRGAIACMISQAKVRVGVDPKGTGMAGKARCYTHLIKEIKGMRHTVEMNLDVIREMGINIKDKALHFHIPLSEMEQVDALLSKAPKEFILVHPVSRWMFKSWPVHLMATLLKEIHCETNAFFVMSAAPVKEEMEFVDKIIALCPQVPILNLSGNVSLKGLGALIHKATALITVDSVPMHLAAAIKTPLVAIFGPTSEQRWAPWQHDKAVVVYQEMPCRPCYQAGCNNSYRSECLETLPVSKVKKAFYSLGNWKASG